MSDKSDLVIFQKTHRGRGRDKKGKIWHGGVKWRKDKSVMKKDTGYPLISGGDGCKDGKMGKRDRFLLTKDEWIEEEEQQNTNKTRVEKWIDKEMMAEGEVNAVSIRKTCTFPLLFPFLQKGHIRKIWQTKHEHQGKMVGRQDEDGDNTLTYLIKHTHLRGFFNLLGGC